MELLYPPTCIACGNSLPEQDVKQCSLSLCALCDGQLSLLDPEGCWRCAAPLPASLRAADEKGCPLCRGISLRLDGTIAAGPYEGLLRELILRAKKVQHETTAGFLAELLWQHRREELSQINADYITCVPMHWRRRLVRQANGPELMAERLARHLSHVSKPKFAPRLLCRRRPTTLQTSLAKSQRLGNVRNAFESRLALDNATILLVDDVMTTGATIGEAARALRTAGAARVVAVVAARSL